MCMRKQFREEKFPSEEHQHSRLTAAEKAEVRVTSLVLSHEASLCWTYKALHSGGGGLKFHYRRPTFPQPSSPVKAIHRAYLVASRRQCDATSSPQVTVREMMPMMMKNSVVTHSGAAGGDTGPVSPVDGLTLPDQTDCEGTCREITY
ncbi:hypothetical protein F7725_003462 [Dissostichus mawsoni]|uniref:Uncharacterized protein n=1 Tax=Dissostichus mawsoni TaxID=36200 RepID=A0A7J5YAF0_DISMA|nr:hypothetical protein F7725_003462 [Dissostichus mawsoni]